MNDKNLLDDEKKWKAFRYPRTEFPLEPVKRFIKEVIDMVPLKEPSPGSLVIVNDRNDLTFTKKALLHYFHYIGYDNIEFINDYGPIADRTLAMKLCYASLYYSQDPCSDDHADRLAEAIGVRHVDSEDLADMVLENVFRRCDEIERR